MADFQIFGEIEFCLNSFLKLNNTRGTEKTSKSKISITGFMKKLPAHELDPRNAKKGIGKPK